MCVSVANGPLVSPLAKVGSIWREFMLQPALLSLASVASQCPKLSLAVPARDAANTLQASLSGWSVPQVEWRASSYCSNAVDAFQALTQQLTLTLTQTQTLTLSLTVTLTLTLTLTLTQWLAFEADPSAASRQTFAPAAGGAVRVLRAGTLHGSARVMAHAPTATHSKVVIGKGSG